MSIGIYALYYGETCLYVGQSKNIEQRYKRHMTRLKSETALQKFNDWFKENNCPHDLIELKILEECEDCDPIKNELEIKWFNDLSPLFYGKVPSLKDAWSHSEETRKKISRSLKIKNGNNNTEDRFCKKCGNSVAKRRILCDNCLSKRSSRNVDEVRLCKRCGAEFSARKKYSKFCGRDCYNKQKREENLERDNKIMELRGTGMSLREISKVIGVSHVTVKVVLDSSSPL